MSLKNEVIKSVEENKIIAILRGISKDKILDTAEALYNGGIRLLEVTFSADKKVSDEETAEIIKILVEKFEGRMYIGAGTVLTAEQVKLTKNAGGSFIISPNVDKKVIKTTVKLGLVSIPGALTPTEICDANKMGADFVKLFPVAGLGSDYIKAVKAPLKHIKMLAVGGVTPDNMQDFFKAGVCGFGIGSNITDMKCIEAGDWEAVTQKARAFVEAL